MAIDNAEKRKSVAGINMLAGPSVTPNSGTDQEWRQQAGFGYSGILADNPAPPSETVLDFKRGSTRGIMHGVARGIG